MYDSFDNTYQVSPVIHCRFSLLLFHPVISSIYNQIFFSQATIGIDFLSKTMYLEDKTVEYRLDLYCFLFWLRFLPCGY